MTSTAPSAIHSPFETHLHSQLTDAARKDDFDMNDGPEIGLPDCPPRLRTALQWLADTVEKEWRDADAHARKSQQHHRQLAQVAIAAGTSAIVLAIVQLATNQTFERLKDVPLILEAIAVVCAVLAVTIGLAAKMDRRWLGHRHRAERLRMLKFRALEKLWCDDGPSWQAWVETQLREIPSASDFHLAEKWAGEGDVEAATLDSASHEDDADFDRGLTALYRFKRLAFQSRYFGTRRDDYQKQTRGWQHLGLPLFLGSIACVLAHFVCEAWADRSPAMSAVLKAAAIWFVAFAAIIPVIGAGIRSWFVAAFELPRSASLFKAKHHALARMATHLDEDSGQLAATQRHIAQTEHFLEDEHREWLRLVRDTEWFL